MRRTVPPIRILHVIGSLNVGGSQKLMMSLYHAIDRSRIQFDFVIDNDDERYYQSEVERLGGKVYTLPKLNVLNIFDYLAAWDGFIKDHPEYRVIHGHVRSTASLYLGIAKKYGRICIAHSHSISNGSGAVAAVKDFLQWPIRYIADYCFACSDLAGEWLFGKRACASERYRLFRNPVNVGHFLFDGQARKTIRSSMDISDDTYVVGNVGRFSDPKNHEFMVKVFYELVKSNPVNSKLLLVGDGELLEPIKKLVCSLGLSREVIFTGLIDDPSLHYSAMDAFLAPSKWEGFPISILEAQASGLPCLISENIPIDVDIVHSLVRRASISSDPEAWSAYLSDWIHEDNWLEGERRVSSGDIKDILFECNCDVVKVAQEMTTFYEKCFDRD